VTAPELFGRLHILPIVQGFMTDYRQVDVSLLLLNRIVSYIDEGIDLGLRIAHLPDSSLQAILVGHVHRICCASPGYISANGAPRRIQELARHAIIATTGVRPVTDRWSFERGGETVSVVIRPRLALNSVQAALDAAVAGGGIVRLLSYQSAMLEAAGDLVRVLDDAPQPPIPIHIVHPAGRHLALKARLFIDRAVGTLREKFHTPS
jgi:DNA-binding transcriptional LysR family regulator